MIVFPIIRYMFVLGGSYMITRVWKIFGKDGHRQRESFDKSRKFYVYDFLENGGEIIIEILNSDYTHTNSYSIIKITAGSSDLCLKHLLEEVSDGVFQNCCVGDIVEISDFNFSAYRAITNLGNCIFFCYANTAMDVKKMLIEHYCGNMIFEIFDCNSILIQKESTINELINTNISYITMETMYREEYNE